MLTRETKLTKGELKGVPVTNISEIKLLQGDCLEEHEYIKDGSVDLILTDPPYGTMKKFSNPYRPKSWGKEGYLDWDNSISPKDLFKIANRILRVNGKLILFSQEPYSNQLLNGTISNLPFKYRMIWLKDHFANALLVNKAPVSYYEDILVFSKDYEKGKNIVPSNPVYEYLQECKKNSGMTIKEFNYLYCDYVGKTANRHRSLLARSWEAAQFLVPTKDIYENVLQPTGFFPLSYAELETMNTHKDSSFNLWQGEKYKSNVLEYAKDYVKYHPTQKPVLLLEDLIKTFSNKEDLVVDLTMGSGSTGVACLNTNRKFIGIELDEEYFKIANERVQKAMRDKATSEKGL